MLITRTPVRISFAGGGTDFPSYYSVHGGEVLSAAINKYFYTVITERTDQMVQLISADFRILEYYSELDHVDPKCEDLSVPLAAIKRIEPNRGMNLFLASEIPPGTGLGSSACVCVNVLKAVSTLAKHSLSKYELAETAFQTATQTLGAAVGKQDEYAAAFGGLNCLRFTEAGTEVVPVELEEATLQDLRARLLLFFLGSSRQAQEILKEQDKASKTGDPGVLSALHAVKGLVVPMYEALTEGDLDRFGSLLDQGWQEKKKFSSKISNPRIDDLYQTARQNGALGGKVTGAGGGGFLLLYVPPASQAPVRQALAKEGLKEMQFSFDFHGARVVYHDPFFDSESPGGLVWRFVQFS